MTNTYTTPSDSDLVLAPKTGLRGRKHTLFGKNSRLVAIVRTDANGGQGYPHSAYGHPTLTLSLIRLWPLGGGLSEEYDTSLLTVGFQRTRLDVPHENPEYDREFHGFMGGTNGRRFGATYAARVEGRLESSQYLAAGLEMIERAKEAIKEDYKLRGALKNCELSSLMIGLRRIGIMVIVKDGRKIAGVRDRTVEQTAELSA